MRVLAIDPGYERMGVAIIEPEKLIYSACVVTSRQLTFSERLLILGREFEVLIAKYQPTLVALEKLFFTTNQKTAGQVSEVRGMLLYLSARHGLPVVEYTPLEVKNTITGYGKAGKHQMAVMVRQLVKIKHEPEHDDEYDAIAIGLTTLVRAKLPK